MYRLHSGLACFNICRRDVLQDLFTIKLNLDSNIVTIKLNDFKPNWEAFQMERKKGKKE